jgi:hypothetical protein
VNRTTTTCQSNIEYTPWDLIGDEYWSRLGAPGKREMELCLKHFAANPEAKLIDTETGKLALSYRQH